MKQRVQPQRVYNRQNTLYLKAMRNQAAMGAKKSKRQQWQAGQ